MSLCASFYKHLIPVSNKYTYYTTQEVRGPITKINQSKCSIAGSIFSKYRTGHCPEWARTCVFAVFAFFSRVINLLLTKLARDRTGRISALGLFCMDLGPIFSQYGPHAWLIRYMYKPACWIVACPFASSWENSACREDCCSSILMITWSSHSYYTVR